MALRLGAHPLAVSVPASQSATPRHCQEAKSVARVTVVASASAKQPEDLAKPVSRRHVFIGAGALAATTSPFFAGARYALAEEEGAEELAPALVDEALEETPVLKAMAELSGFLQELKKLTELP
ncbi:unnamed protein product [Closterium sp. Naga37s-1]|nr:unnamed protein product [Closterium sp. Naga37s-1]